MIGYLRGSVVFVDTSYVLIDVSGVGYKVLLPTPVLSKLTTSDLLTVFIHTYVREDVLELYGFPGMADLKLFEMLISVSGIGCKTALHIFSLGNRSEIVNAIHTANTAFFSGIPRLGKKNAQKIIIELKGKFGEGAELDLSQTTLDHDEVIEALKVFGYSVREATEAYRNVSQDGLSTEEKIKMALKYLGK